MDPIRKISSRDNRRLVDARKVRDGKDPDKIFVEGQRLVAEALRSRLNINDCFIVEGFRNIELLGEVSSVSSEIVELPERIFNSIADTASPQGIVLIAERPHSALTALDVVNSDLPLVLYLSEINNPSNLGAVLRTAEAAGIVGVIVSPGSADVYSPKALRAAMGASFRLSVVENTAFDYVLEWAKDKELVLTASAANSELTYTKANWTLPRLLIFGSEAHGLKKDQLEAVNETIQIPMANGVESLNLAVSAGIILFEARRQFTAIQ